LDSLAAWAALNVRELMSDVAIHVDHCWKKFRKGEFHDSLRELIPAVAKRLIGRGKKNGGDLQDREFWALKDVNFEVKKGESLGIIGPNGAGKSTMLKMLSRIIKPNRGSYKVTGRLSSLIEVGAGFHPDLTGRENIYLNGTILGMPRKVIAAKEEEIIDFAGVESFIETPVKRYSSGMRARLGFAVCAHMDPDVLLVDEVLSVGDAMFRQKCIQHMLKLIESDVTVVFISHILEQVKKLCPQTLVLDQGSIVYQGGTDHAITKYYDLLSGTSDANEDGDTSEAELQNIRFCDEEGNEVLQWKSNQPNMITCDLVIHKPLDDLSMMIDISTVSGQYIGCANTRNYDYRLPADVGVYQLKYLVDPIPFADGELTLKFKINHRESPNARVVWSSRHPHVVSVRGIGGAGNILRFRGGWSCEKVDSPHLAPVDSLRKPCA
jgi:lipopolysaccharide transport system ATP-binding protein